MATARMPARSSPAAASAVSSGSPGPGSTGCSIGSEWNRARSAGSVISAVFIPVSSSSQPPSQSSATAGTGSRSSSPGAPATDTDFGTSTQPRVSGTIRRTPKPIILNAPAVELPRQPYGVAGAEP
jgi:hypothetical protein